MNPNKTLWEQGDFTRIAATMRESGHALVESLDVRQGMEVLDLGCGDGTTAVPLAELGANVLGIDIAANLVAADMLAEAMNSRIVTTWTRMKSPSIPPSTRTITVGSPNTKTSSPPSTNAWLSSY